MKRIVLLLVFMLLAAHSFAQTIRKDNVPAVVLNSFQVNFPSADDVSWKLNDGNYQIKYKVNNKWNEVLIDYKGGVLKQQQDLHLSEIPKPVLETLGSKESVFDVSDAKRTVENGKTLYELVCNISGKRRFFWINEKGDLLKYRKELNDNEIPASILSFIKNTYPPFDHIDRAKYVEENGKIYYIVAGRGHVFLFDDKVNVLEHHQDLQESKVPAPILKAIRESYNGYKVLDTDLVEKRGVATYTLRMGKSNKEVIVTLDPEGRILSAK